MDDSKIKACKYCNDKGYSYDAEINGPAICRCIKKKCVCANENNNLIYNPKTNAYRSCDCKLIRTKINKIKTIFKTADIPEKYQWKFIKHFEMLDSANKTIPNIENFSTIIENVIENYSNPNKRRGIVFWSELTGSGKTLAAAIILNTLIFEHAATAKFIKLSSDYFGRLKNSYKSFAFNDSDYYSRENERDIIKDLINYDALVIDDFGTQRGTDWEKEKLYELIDGRNDNKKITIITSNKNFSAIEIEALTDRILSRIIEMCIIYAVKTPCYRQKFFEKL